MYTPTLPFLLYDGPTYTAPFAHNYLISVLRSGVQRSSEPGGISQSEAIFEPGLFFGRGQVKGFLARIYGFSLGGYHDVSKTRGKP